MKIYIAGPMRGKPQLNFPAFNSAAKRLRDRGHTVINPVELDHNANDYGSHRLSYYLRRDLPELISGDAIALLPGWQESAGATSELNVARMVGLRIYEYSDDRLYPLRLFPEGLKHLNEAEPEDMKPGAVSLAEERVTDPTTGGAKGQKIYRYDLLPGDVLEQDAYLYGVGARKYDERNWERGYKMSLSMAALMRHLMAYWQKRESLDPEGGFHHLAAVRFHAAAMMRFEKMGTELDDRPMMDPRYLATAPGQKLD